MADETYTIALVSDTERFAPGVRDAVNGLNKVKSAAENIERTEKRTLSIDEQKARLARQRRQQLFDELGITEKLFRLEERRRRLAEYISRASSRGMSGRVRALGSSMDSVNATIGILSAAAPRSALRAARGFINGSGDAAATGNLAGAGLMLRGGLLGAAGTSAVMAARGLIRGLASIPRQALEMDALGKEMERTMKQALDFSDGARRNLADMQIAWDAMFGVLRKGVGETASFIVSSFRAIGGTLISTLGSVLGKIPGLKKIGAEMTKAGDNAVVQSVGNLPKWIGGLGGMDQSGGLLADQKRAEIDADKEKDRRKRIRDDREKAEKRTRELYRDQMRWAMGGSEGVSSMFSGSQSGNFVAAGGAMWKVANIQQQTLNELRKNTQATVETTRAIKETSSF